MDINCRPRRNMSSNPLLQPRCVGLRVVTPIMCHICEQVRKMDPNSYEFIQMYKQWHMMVDIQLEMEAKHD